MQEAHRWPLQFIAINLLWHQLQGNGSAPAPLTNNNRMISLRSASLLRQPSCSHCLLGGGLHVCLEQTHCRNLIGTLCTHTGNLSFRCSSGQYERPQASYDTLDGPQLSRLSCVGLCLDDRSNTHARKKCLGLAYSLRPGATSDAHVFRLVSPTSHTAVIDRLSLPRHTNRRRLLDATARE